MSRWAGGPKYGTWMFRRTKVPRFPTALARTPCAAGCQKTPPILRGDTLMYNTGGNSTGTSPSAFYPFWGPFLAGDITVRVMLCDSALAGLLVYLGAPAKGGTTRMANALAFPIHVDIFLPRREHGVWYQNNTHSGR